MKTLGIEASPKGDDALSSQLALAYLDTADAVGEVERFPVWDDDALRVGRDAAIAKFAQLFGEPITDDQQAVWRQLLGEIERVFGFDRLVSSPMRNWHVTHALKAWIDIIVQPVASFTLNERGEHVGTLGQGKPLQLILTRSSAYDGRHPELQDFQKPYLEYVFGILGYRVDTLVVEPTTRWTPAEREQMRTEAIERARTAGR